MMFFSDKKVKDDTLDPAYFANAGTMSMKQDANSNFIDMEQIIEAVQEYIDKIVENFEEEKEKLQSEITSNQREIKELKEKLNSLTIHKQVTQEEYDSLPEEQKQADIEYFISNL